MIKRKIKETTREYDETGKLVRETVTETEEDDDTTYWPDWTYRPSFVTYADKTVACSNGGTFAESTAATALGGNG